MACKGKMRKAIAVTERSDDLGRLAGKLLFSSLAQERSAWVALFVAVWRCVEFVT
jgi:hypothetical protein